MPASGSDVGHAGAIGADAQEPSCCSADGGWICPVQGEDQRNDGSFQATVSGSANPTSPLPASMKCAASYVAGGPQQIYEFDVRCFGYAGDTVYEFTFDVAGKPVAGDSYPVGTESGGLVLPDGGFVHGESQLSWEESARSTCDPNSANADKAWGPNLASKGGAIVFDKVDGKQVTFHVTETQLAVNDAGHNKVGTGALTLSGSGTVTVSNL